MIRFEILYVTLGRLANHKLHRTVWRRGTGSGVWMMDRTHACATCWRRLQPHSAPCYAHSLNLEHDGCVIITRPKVSSQGIVLSKLCIPLGNRKHVFLISHM